MDKDKQVFDEWLMKEGGTLMFKCTDPDEVEQLFEKIQSEVTRLINKTKTKGSDANTKEVKAKVCPPGKELNPKTNRCNKIKVTKSKRKPKEQDKPAKVCPPGKELNPKTNRCIKVTKSKKKPKTPSPDTPSEQYAKFYNIIDEIDPDNDGYYIDDKYDNDKHFINVINGSPRLKKTILKDLKLGDILFVGTAGGDEYGFIIYLDNDIYYGENGYSGPIRYLKDCREGMGKEKECEKMKTIRYSKLVMDLHDNNQEMYGLFGGDWLGLDDIKKEYESLGIW
jgi:hypothetical protein